MSLLLLFNMRGLGAMLVLDHIFLAGAFRGPIASSLGSSLVVKTPHHVSRSFAAFRPHYAVNVGDAHGDALQSAKPVLSFPGGGIFFWVSVYGLQRRGKACSRRSLQSPFLKYSLKLHMKFCSTDAVVYCSMYTCPRTRTRHQGMFNTGTRNFMRACWTVSRRQICAVFSRNKF